MREEKLQIAISKYLKLQYPDVYFMSDSSGLRLPMGLAVKAKKQRSKHAQLDMVILEPSSLGYGALILELKKDKSQVLKKNGEYRNTPHIKDQNKSISHLRRRNYWVQYVYSLDEAIDIINYYIDK